MKAKTQKKLTLKKETLRTLDTPKLDGVVGGAEESVTTSIVISITISIVTTTIDTEIQ